MTKLSVISMFVPMLYFTQIWVTIAWIDNTVCTLHSQPLVISDYGVHKSSWLYIRLRCLCLRLTLPEGSTVVHRGALVRVRNGSVCVYSWYMYAVCVCVSVYMLACMHACVCVCSSCPACCGGPYQWPRHTPHIKGLSDTAVS